MKKLLAILSIMLIAPCFASTLFQYDNPFPQYSDTSNLNNIYETRQEAIKKDIETAKKNRWWSRKDKAPAAKQEIQPVNVEESSDGSFVVFPAK